MADSALTEAQIAQYGKEGYVVAPALFGREALDLVDRAVEELTERALNGPELEQILELEPDAVDGRPMARRIYNPFEVHDAFRSLGTDTRLLDCIEALIGSAFGIQHSKLNMKPAHVGSAVEWHQDLSYFPHTNDSLVTTLVYLDDANEANGCLQVLPRLHDHFLDHFLPDGSFAGMITEDLSDGRYGDPVSLSAPAGSVIFMHCLTPHSSLPNTSAHPRRTLIYEYRAADSFPLYIDAQTVKTEQAVHHLRGELSRFARFAGPPPMIPRAEQKYTSLYDRQTQAKAALAAAGS